MTTDFEVLPAKEFCVSNDELKKCQDAFVSTFKFWETARVFDKRQFMTAIAFLTDRWIREHPEEGVTFDALLEEVVGKGRRIDAKTKN